MTSTPHEMSSMTTGIEHGDATRGALRADATATDSPRRFRFLATGLFLGAVLVGATACGDGRNYDISPIFPLSSDKCATYDGKSEGSGLNATCMVTKENCERAANDWRNAMSSGGVPDAITFRCD